MGEDIFTTKVSMNVNEREESMNFQMPQHMQSQSQMRRTSNSSPTSGGDRYGPIGSSRDGSRDSYYRDDRGGGNGSRPGSRGEYDADSRYPDRRERSRCAAMPKHTTVNI